jgi:tyrosine-protein phosphatase OCA1
MRKLQRWALAPIFEEYRRYTGHKVRLQNEQFIELFDVDLVSVTDHAPEFLKRSSARARV